MASKVIQFPVRNAFAQPRSHDSLARDTQHHASRIAQQIEEEMALKAARLAVGMRIQFADARRASNVVSMPSQVQTRQVKDKFFAAVRRTMRSLAGRLLFPRS